MPFGDVTSLFTLAIMLVGGGLFLRIVAREKDRRDRHIQMRFFEMEGDASKAPAESKSSESSSDDYGFVGSRE